MPTRTNRLERITNLLLALLHTNRPLSLREIGASVAGYPADTGALRQAFERDKRTLRDEGIPITTERIDGDDQVGYRILPEQYYLADLELDPDERQALSFALAAVRLDTGVSRDLGAKIAAGAAADVPPVVVLPTFSALGPLQEALRAKSLVEFDYRGRHRALAGYALAFKDGSWYFVARPIEEGASDEAGSQAANSRELRTFRVDRIEGELKLGPGSAYEIPDDFDLADALRFWRPEAANGAIEVTVDVDVREARRALALAGAGARIDGAPEGSVRLRFGVGDVGAFLSWALGLGDAIEVLTPIEIRQEIVDRLRATLDGVAS